MRKICGLEKNIFILGLTSFFNDFSNEMILAAFPAFFTSVLKSGAASLGFVEGIADGASNFLKIASGNISDRMQRRRAFIFIGYTLSVMMRPFYMFTGNVGEVLGLRFLDRVGKGVREAPRDVIISVSSDPAEIGRSFGYHRMMDTMGGILGPLAAYFILREYPGNFNMIFGTAFILGLIAIATIFFVKEVVSATGPNGGKIFSFDAFRALSPGFRLYASSVFILSLGSLPVAILLLKTDSIGLTIASIPLFYMLYNISSAFFSYFAGKLSDRIGTTRVLAAGYLILVISYVFIVLATSSYALALAFVVLGMFSACTDATQRAYVAHMTNEAERGTAYGLMNAAVGFGAMVAGIGGGYIWQMVNPNVALALSSFAIIFGLIFMYVGIQVNGRRNA